MILLWVGLVVLKNGSAFKLRIKIMGCQAMVCFLDTGFQELWEKGGGVGWSLEEVAYQSMRTLISTGHWKHLCPKYSSVYCQYHHVARFYCLGCVCGLRDPLDFPDYLIPWALVFSDLFFPAVAGSEHMKDVAYWQPCPVSWLMGKFILYGGKTCLVHKLQ